MRAAAVALPLLAAIVPLPISAQSPEEAAAMNMQLALETCMRHQGRENALPAAFQAAGFEVTPAQDAGDYQFEAPGVWGYIAGETGGGYCTVQSARVPLALAETIGTAVGERLFPGQVTPGSPAGNAATPPAPCEGYSIWDTRPVITVSYAQAGNSGECVNDGTSAIILRM